ncbi:uncharacterized protein F5147DRAFT_656956 [Suillus discolor]|uniref:Uncharacterized protein n=1 Tax=Suillus discolor TaxID=1912936 RepID=A0A9P7EWV2_9AGAM|nr:uncharacterized protein F5147DRAFT_656956 [Suillus discolor]KAG2095310.1 hypothetical protein F5147DRAFT_656956 [Suillus discolor]
MPILELFNDLTNIFSTDDQQEQPEVVFSDFQDDGRKNAAHSLFFLDNIRALMVAISDYTSDAFLFTGGNNVMLRDGRGQQRYEDKPVAWNFGIAESSNIYILNNIIILAGSDNALNVCREGFSAADTELLFKNSYVVNGDDYLAIVSGAKNIAWSLFQELKKRTSVTWKDITFIDATFPIYLLVRHETRIGNFLFDHFVGVINE